MRYWVPLSTGKWARYIGRKTIIKPFLLMKAIECLLNRLTPFNFEIYYKEKNYLEVRTVFLKYITSFYSKGSVY